MSGTTGNRRICKDEAMRILQEKLRRDIRMLLVVIFTLAMSTAVFALDGSGTKYSPYLVNNSDEFTEALSKSGYVKINEDFANYSYTNVKQTIDGTLNIDLNGHIISLTNNTVLESAINILDGEIVISDSKKSGYIETKKQINVFNVTGTGKLIINSGTVKSADRIAVKTEKQGSLIMNGGAIITESDTTAALYACEHSNITVNGGSIESKSSAADNLSVIAVKDDSILTVNEKLTQNISLYNNATIIINGAYLSSPITLNDNSKIKLNGGLLCGVIYNSSAVYPETALNNGTVLVGFKSSLYPISKLVSPYTTIKEDEEKIGDDIYEIGGDYKTYKQTGHTDIYIRFDTPVNIIFDVDVTLSKPKIGSTPDMSAAINTDGVTLYKTDPVTWYKDGSIMRENEVFEIGHRYSVAVCLQAQNGYYFATDDSFSPAVTGSLNYTTATIEKAYEQTADEVIKLSYDFGTLQKTAVSAVEITADAPQAGKTPDFMPLITEGCVFQMPSKTTNTAYWYDGIKWFDETDGAALKPTDSFIKGHDYTLYINIVPDDYFVFDSPTVSINGHSVEAWGSSEIQIWYTFKEGLMGDVDKNGFVDDADVALLMKYITGIEPVLSELQIEVAKVTDSEKDRPDMLDVIAILKIAENQ